MKLDFFASYIVLWALVVFQGLLILALLRQLAELRRLVERGGLPGEDWLPAGAQAPEFVGVEFRSGRRVSSRDLDGRGAVILFLSPECSTCKDIVSGLGRPTTNGLPPIIAFCLGEKQPCLSFVKRLNWDAYVTLESAYETAARYRVSVSPTAVIVDGERKIRGYGHPQNTEDLNQFWARNLGGGSSGLNDDGKKDLAPLISRVSQ